MCNLIRPQIQFKPASAPIRLGSLKRTRCLCKGGACVVGGEWRVMVEGEQRGGGCVCVCGGGTYLPPTQEAAEFHSRSELKRGEGLKLCGKKSFQSHSVW